MGWPAAIAAIVSTAIGAGSAAYEGHRAREAARDQQKKVDKQVAEEKKAMEKYKEKTPPEAPPKAIPETGGEEMHALRSKRRKAGRTSTVSAGSLVPQDVGRKTLLG